MKKAQSNPFRSSMRLPIITTSTLAGFIFLVLECNNLIQPSSCFNPSITSCTRSTIPRNKHTTHLNASSDDDISRQLSKAKELLEKAKAKMAQQQAPEQVHVSQQQPQLTPQKAEDSETLATVQVEKAPIGTVVDRKQSVIKSRNEETGLITCDGDVMAALSEEEEWELMGIFDVFENEIEESDVSKHLAERDVAASIMNLRLSLHNEDFRKIFDKRNRWIGED